MAMMPKIEVEVIPVIRPDVKEIIESILNQNNQILSQNARLIDLLTKPITFKAHRLSEDGSKENKSETS